MRFIGENNARMKNTITAMYLKTRQLPVEQRRKLVDKIGDDYSKENRVLVQKDINNVDHNFVLCSVIASNVTSY